MPIRMSAGEIAKLVKGEVRGDGSIIVEGLAKIEEAQPHQLCFVANPKYARYLESSRAGIILINEALSRPNGCAIIVDNPYLAFVRLLESFHPFQRGVEPGVHPTAVVHESVKLGRDVAIGAFAVVEAGAEVRDGCTLYPRTYVGENVLLDAECILFPGATLRRGVQLGRRVVVQNGAVIGSDGFGFAPEQNTFRKIPQVGTVVLEDDVEIGANTTIDRATMGETRIKRGTKIDNLCQIAHNVTIGEHCVIAAQTGIAGSTVIGDGCRIGGQVGIVGHLKIGDRSQFAAQSGVSNSIPEDSIVSGSPARPIALWRRVEASLNRLPELFKRLRRIETHLNLREANDQKETSA